MQIAPPASGSTRGLARQQVTGESDDTDRSHTRCIGHDMITMGTKALTRGIEQLDLLVAALCGVVLLLEGYDIAAIGYAVPLIADAWRLTQSGFTPALTAGNVGLLLGSFGIGVVESNID